MGILTQNTTVPALQNLVSKGTEELRNYISENIIQGDERELDRITKYHLYWHFYNGLHWKDYNHTFLSFNYVKAFIDKVSQFLLGKNGFSIKIKSHESDVVDSNTKKAVERLLSSVWNRNKKLLFSYELLQMGSVTGDAWVNLSWNSAKKMVVFKILDSRHCFPEFSKTDPGQVEAFMYRVPIILSESQKKTQVYRLRVFRYTKDSIESWMQKDTNYSPNKVEKFEYKEEKNTYGFIPVVHFKNKPQSSGYYSTSDAESIVKLNKVYNELAVEIKSIIDYYSTPTTIVKGASIKNLKKGLGNVWSGLPSDADVYNLGLDADLSEANAFLDRLKTGMHEMSDVPENFLGKIQAISNTSAAALQLTYQPVIQQADMKWMMYGDGIREMNDLIISMYQTFGKDSTLMVGVPNDFSELYEAVPVFSYGFPSDRELELRIASEEIRLELNSRENIMERLGYDNVPEVVEQIAEERIKMAEKEAARLKITNPMAFTPPNNFGSNEQF